jgi:hypothetical protein
MAPSERIKRIEESCPAPEAWRLANFPEPGLALLAAKLHESIGHGTSRVKRILAGKLTADTPEDYRRLADALDEPTIREWGRLLKWLVRLDEPHATDPVEELAAFLRIKEFTLDAKGFELAIPLSLRVPAVIPNGKLSITISPPTGTAEVIPFEQSGEGVSQGLATVYRFVPEKPANIVYHPGDSLKLELPVRSGEQRFTLSWNDGATKTFQFDRWQREPRLVSASGSEPATGVKLTLQTGSQWPRLPLLLPEVRREKRKVPSADRSELGTGSCFSLLAHVDFEVREIHFAVVHGMAVVRDAAPVDVATTAHPTAIALHLALALDAEGAVRQGVEPCDQDLAAARLALAVRSLLQAAEGPLDLGEFLGFQFGQLRGHFLAAGVECRVGRVPGLRRFAARQVGQFHAQPLPQFVPPGR